MSDLNAALSQAFADGYLSSFDKHIDPADMRDALQMIPPENVMGASTD